MGHLLGTARHYHRRAWRWWRVAREGSLTATLRRPRRVGDGDARLQRRALVVRLDAIGDFVLWTGAARALREWMGPQTKVTLAANAVWADLARTQEVADEVWPVERQALEWDGAYRDALRARVTQGQFDIAVNPRWTREMMLADSVIRWSGAPERIGLVGDDMLLPPNERRVADRWYTALHDLSPLPNHESERHAAFLRAIGVAVPSVPIPRLLDAPADATASRDRPYFVVSPGASLPHHRWPAERFAQLSRAVAERTGWRAVVVGDASEGDIAAQVAAAVPDARNRAGATSLDALVALIRGARLVLTNDTAAVHIAAATGAHAVCLGGGWHWERFVPYPATLGPVADTVHTVSVADEMSCFRCRGYCSVPHPAGGPRPCLERISVARALETVERVLSLPDLNADG